MIKKLSMVCAAALLAGACADSTSAPGTAAPSSPAPKQFAVFFGVDSAQLDNRASATVGEAYAAYQAEFSARISASGYTDRAGSEEYNMALSMRRANAVKEALVQRGVPASSIVAVARGENDPMVVTADQVSEAKNRRVVVAVMSRNAEYCRALTVKYREYARNTQIDNDAAVAILRCEQGNPAAGIPVLMTLLTNAKVALPPRE